MADEESFLLYSSDEEVFIGKVTDIEIKKMASLGIETDDIPEYRRAHNRPATRRDSSSRLENTNVINTSDNSVVEVIDLSPCGKNDSIQVISSESDDSFTSFGNSSKPKLSNSAKSDIADEDRFSEAIGGLDLICDNSIDQNNMARFNEEQCAQRTTSISPIFFEEPESGHYSVKEFDLIHPAKGIEEMKYFKIAGVNPCENEKREINEAESFQNTNIPDFPIVNKETIYVEGNYDLETQEVDDNKKTGKVEPFQLENTKTDIIESIDEIPMMPAPQSTISFEDLKIIEVESFRGTYSQDVVNLENEKTRYIEGFNDVEVQNDVDNKKTSEVETSLVENLKHPTVESIFAIPIISAPQDALKNKTGCRKLTSESDIWNDVTVSDTDYQTPSASFKLSTKKNEASFNGELSLNAISDSILNISHGSSIPSPVYEDITDPDLHMSVDEVDFLSIAGSDRHDLVSKGNRETGSSYFTAYSKAFDDNQPSVSFEQYRTGTDLQIDLEELVDIKNSIRETSFEAIVQNRQNSFSGIAASAEVNTEVARTAQKKFASKLPVMSSSKLIKPPKLVFKDVPTSAISGKPGKKAGSLRLPKATSVPKLTESPRMPKVSSMPKPTESPRLMRSTSVTKSVLSPRLPRATSVPKLGGTSRLQKPAESPRLPKAAPMPKPAESPCLPKATSVPKLLATPRTPKPTESPRLPKAASMHKPAEPPCLLKATSVPKLLATPRTPKPTESPCLPKTASVVKPNKFPYPAKATLAKAEGLKSNVKTPVSKIPTTAGCKIPTTLQLKALSSSKKNSRFGSVISPIRAYITGTPIVMMQSADLIVSPDQASKSVGKNMKLNVAKPSTVTKCLNYSVKEGQENVDPAYNRDTLPPRVFEHANAVFMKDSEHPPKHLPKIGENLKKMISPTKKITVHQGRVKDVPPAAKGVLIPQIMIQSPSPLKPTKENFQHDISIRIQTQCDL